MKRFVAKPSDRAAVVRELAESGGGSLESYYWMFGQYDGVGVFGMPDSHSMAAVSLTATSSGAFTRFETHELIEGRRSHRDRRAGEGDHLPAARHLTGTQAWCPARWAPEPKRPEPGQSPDVNWRAL